MQYLSVVIITYNEERNIRRCIDSVKRVADEIIVVDSFSTDRTVDIALESGAVVHREKFRGYIEQKRFAAELASYNLILSLDADEAIDHTLALSILRAKKEMPSLVFSMNRSTNYCGKFIHHGLWYPDRKIRLFDRRFAYWGGMNPHDKIMLTEKIPVVHLKGDILHYSFASVEEHIEQNNRLSSIAAQSMHLVGRKAHWFHLLLNPAWAFINGYFLRLGFLDGLSGLIVAIRASNYTYLKYLKLLRLQKIPDVQRGFVPE